VEAVHSKKKLSVSIVPEAARTLVGEFGAAGGSVLTVIVDQLP